MSESTVPVQIPGSLLQFGIGRDEIERRVSEWLVFSLFSEGHISSGKAAKLMGITRLQFIALLRTRGIAYVNETPEELQEEFKAVETLDADLKS
jgi:predicted HTH domain antitoxin